MNAIKLHQVEMMTFPLVLSLTNVLGQWFSNFEHPDPPKKKVSLTSQASVANMVIGQQ